MCRVSACSLALFRVSGPKTGSKHGPKLPPAFSVKIADRAGHAYASSTRSRHSAIFLVTRARRPRVRVIRADSNPRVRITAFFSIPRGRVSHACASMFAGHHLSFLCSFHFCKLPLHSLSHSCPIKFETLNTRITASNGIKQN